MSPESDTINPKATQLFSPLGSRSREQPAPAKNLAEALYPAINDACMFPYLDLGPTIAQHESDIYADVNVIHEEEVIATELPCPLPALSEEAASVQEF